VPTGIDPAPKQPDIAMPEVDPSSELLAALVEQLKVVVVPCTSCGASGRAAAGGGKVCTICNGWGRIRVPTNVLPFYKKAPWGPKPEILTEG